MNFLCHYILCVWLKRRKSGYFVNNYWNPLMLQRIGSCDKTRESMQIVIKVIYVTAQDVACRKAKVKKWPRVIVAMVKRKKSCASASIATFYWLDEYGETSILTASGYSFQAASSTNPIQGIRKKHPPTKSKQPVTERPISIISVTLLLPWVADTTWARVLSSWTVALPFSPTCLPSTWRIHEGLFASITTVWGPPSAKNEQEVNAVKHNPVIILCLIEDIFIIFCK